MIVSAEFSRGAGLGNKLFPWGRAKIFSHTYKCPLLQTRWFSLHGGGITRGGIDYSKAIRKIWLLGNFRADAQAVNSLIGKIKYGFWPVKKCGSLLEAMQLRDLQKNINLQFAWDKNHNFEDFANKQQFLLTSLKNITLKSQISFVRNLPEHAYIGINVRCGKDFVLPGSAKSGYVQTELDWFCNALTIVRREYGNLPAIVVSDGGQKQLAQLLAMPNVRLLNSQTAIADLLVLTGAKVLLGSGNSTFSAWASFLGEMDTFSSPNTPFKFLGIENGRGGKKVVGTIP